MGAAVFARALHNTRAPVQSPHLSLQLVFVDRSIAANFIFSVFPVLWLVGWHHQCSSSKTTRLPLVLYPPLIFHPHDNSSCGSYSEGGWRHKSWGLPLPYACWSDLEQWKWAYLGIRSHQQFCTSLQMCHEDKSHAEPHFWWRHCLPRMRAEDFRLYIW